MRDPLHALRHSMDTCAIHCTHYVTAWTHARSIARITSQHGHMRDPLHVLRHSMDTCAIHCTYYVHRKAAAYDVTQLPSDPGCTARRASQAENEAKRTDTFSVQHVRE
jgi:hypothetical protein